MFSYSLCMSRWISATSVPTTSQTKIMWYGKTCLNSLGLLMNCGQKWWTPVLTSRTTHQRMWWEGFYLGVAGLSYSWYSLQLTQGTRSRQCWWTWPAIHMQEPIRCSQYNPQALCLHNNCVSGHTAAIKTIFSYFSLLQTPLMGSAIPSNSLSILLSLIYPSYT